MKKSEYQREKKSGIYLIERGRSMVEMLCVLAIIGVLSVIGVVGIQYAMQIYKENETVHAFSVATAGARTAELMQNYVYKCDGFPQTPCVVKPNSVVSTKYDTREDDFTTAIGSPVQVRIEDDRGYTVRIRGISREVCESIKSGDWGETCAGIDKNGTTLYPTPDCVALQNLDCMKFENAHSGFVRRSALQEEIGKNEKTSTVNFKDAGHNALVLYYAEAFGVADDDGTGPGYERVPLESHTPGDPDDPDDPDDPGDPDNPDDPGGPDDSDPDDSDPDDEPYNIKKCRDYGGVWTGWHCCNNAMNVYTGQIDKAGCCDGYKPKRSVSHHDLEDDGTCCKENGGTYIEDAGVCCQENSAINLYTNQQSVWCCEQDETSTNYWGGTTCCNSEGKDASTLEPTKECCEKYPGGGTWLEDSLSCCIGIKNLRTDTVDPVCCQKVDQEATVINETCCKDGVNVETGQLDQNCCDGEWHAQEQICCQGIIDQATDEPAETCCPKGNWHDGVCCEGIKNVATGMVDEKCCNAEDGTWVESTCCDNKGRNMQTQEYTTQCCTKGVGSIGRNYTCCSGSINVSTGAIDTENCCNNGKSYDGKPDKECCEANITASWNSKSNICCEKDSSKDFLTKKRRQECCENANGEWKGSWCCAKKEVRQSTTMCY